MADRIPAWIKRVGLVLLGLSVFAAVLARTVDAKKWLRTLWQCPRVPAVALSL